MAHTPASCSPSSLRSPPVPARLDILATHFFLTSLVIALLCRAIQDLHRETAQKLRVDNGCIEEVEALLKQLEQLLVGISIMQVRGRPGWGGGG